MKDLEKDIYQPKRSSGTSPTDMLERRDPKNPAKGELSKDRYLEGSNSETAQKYEAKPSEDDRFSSASDDLDTKTRELPPLKTSGGIPKREETPTWGDDNPADGYKDESQPGFNALEPDQK